MLDIFKDKRVLISLVVGAVLAVIAAFLLNGYLLNRSAKMDLLNINKNLGSITAFNDELLLFTEGQVIEKTNIEQKGLGKHGELTRPASFIFSNNVKNEEKKIIRAYLDFSEQRSRDFILLNQDLLKNLVEKGIIDLHIYSIPTGNAFSIYASEALAEAFATSPGSSWDYFIDLMKASAELERDKDHEDTVERIVELAEKNNIDEIDEDSVLNGTFGSWLLTVAEDPFLSHGVLLPELFVGEVPVSDIVNINNSEELKKIILNREE